MACEHFIELIHKHNLIRSKDFLENEMKKRYEHTKNNSYRNEETPYVDKETQTHGNPIPYTASVELSPF